MIAQSRRRVFRKEHGGYLADTGWDLVQYDGMSEMWEPVDTILNCMVIYGPSKRITDIFITDEPADKREGALVGGNVGVLRSAATGQ